MSHADCSATAALHRRQWRRCSVEGPVMIGAPGEEQTRNKWATECLLTAESRAPSSSAQEQSTANGLWCSCATACAARSVTLRYNATVLREGVHSHAPRPTSPPSYSPHSLTCASPSRRGPQATEASMARRADVLRTVGATSTSRATNTVAIARFVRVREARSSARCVMVCTRRGSMEHREPE